MTPGARAQASIELLDQIFQAWNSEKRIPADKLLQNYFKSHRFIGSKDRGAVSELVYWVLRHKAALEWWLAEKFKSPVHARAIVLTALMLRKDFTVAELAAITQDSQYSLPSLTPPEKLRCEELYKHCHPEAQPKDLSSEQPSKILRGAQDDKDMPDPVRLNYPEWLDGQLRETFGKDFEKALHALNEQAPTDLRVNTLKTTREALQQQLKNEGFETEPTPLSPIGLRLSKRGPVFTTEAFKKGHFEVQDEGSQMAALMTDTSPGMRVIDFCAGAGGKTLAMAAQMKNKGRILAWDTSEKRLAQIVLRLRRAGVDNVQTHVIESESDAFIKRHKQTADRVLVDAPCSGTGTWRRNPDLKWRFTPKDLEEVVVLQQSILQSAARLVKPGGRLIYATCSVLRAENEHQVDRFLKSAPNFKVVCAEKVWNKNATMNENEVSYLSLTPHEDGVDGFFAAVFERA